MFSNCSPQAIHDIWHDTVIPEIQRFNGTHNTILTMNLTGGHSEDQILNNTAETHLDRIKEWENKYDYKSDCSIS